MIQNAPLLYSPLLWKEGGSKARAVSCLQWVVCVRTELSASVVWFLSLLCPFLMKGTRVLTASLQVFSLFTKPRRSSNLDTGSQSQEARFVWYNFLQVLSFTFRGISSLIENPFPLSKHLCTPSSSTCFCFNFEWIRLLPSFVGCLAKNI